MEGWRPVEDIVRWGFGQAPVVMANEWVPMGWNFRELSGIDPFVIDQTVTVNLSGRPPGHAQELPESLADTFAELGGTAGMTGEEPAETLLAEDGA